MEYNTFVDRMTKVVGQAEKARIKAPNAPKTADLIKTAQDYQAAHAGMREALDPGFWSSLASGGGKAVAGGLASLEASLLPSQLDKLFARPGSRASEVAGKRLDVTDPAFYGSAGLSMLPGMTGTGLGSIWTRGIPARAVPDLPRLNAVSAPLASQSSQLPAFLPDRGVLTQGLPRMWVQ